MSERLLTIRAQSVVPTSEFHAEFAQKMYNAMSVSFFKYGKVEDAYPHKLSALKSLQQRIAKYLATGNTEYLVDVANFAMIEFMRPSVPGAVYKATDSDGSPGRTNVEGAVTKANNANVPTAPEDNSLAKHWGLA